MDNAQRAAKAISDLQFVSYLAALDAAIEVLKKHKDEVKKTKAIPEGDGELLEILVPDRNGLPRTGRRDFAGDMDKVLEEAKDWLCVAEIATSMGLMKPSGGAQVASCFARQAERRGWKREKFHVDDDESKPLLWYYTKE